MLNALYQDWQDEKLLKAFASGDREAFTQLYARHAGHLFTHLYRINGNRASAEDIAQDAWLSVINHANQFDSSQRFTTWLFTIARRRQIDRWRKHSTKKRVLGKPLIDALDQATDAGVYDGFNQVELQDLIDRVRKLSDTQLEALLLKIAGFSQKDIAKITDSETEAVKSRLRYATRALRLARSSAG